jgi:hypothetical protein
MGMRCVGAVAVIAPPSIVSHFVIANVTGNRRFRREGASLVRIGLL